MFEMHSDGDPQHDLEQWYAVRVKSNRERVTGQAMRGRGVEASIPEYQRRSFRRGREHMISQPLFPGYVFCRFSDQTRLPVMMIPGVLHVVSIGGRPAPIDADEMMRVFTLAESELNLSPHPYLAAGQTVRIDEGPLKGVDGIVLSDEGQPKLVVSVTLLQRSVAVNVNREWLSAPVTA